MMKRTILFLIIGGISLVFIGCKKKVEAPPLPPKPVTVEVEFVEPEYEKYYYFDKGRRDPFVPLTGRQIVKEIEPGEKMEEMEIVEEETVTVGVDIRSLELCGVVWDDKGEVALLSAEEDEYILSDEVLIDSEGEIVKDIKGKREEDGIALYKGEERTLLKIEEETSWKEGEIE
jgi:hypothetical protein